MSKLKNTFIHFVGLTEGNVVKDTEENKVNKKYETLLTEGTEELEETVDIRQTITGYESMVTNKNKNRKKVIRNPVRN